MNKIEQFADELRRIYPNASIDLDKPMDADGHWWLNFYLGDNEAQVEWIPNKGFGVSVNSPSEYGEKSDEFYMTKERAFARFKSLIDSGKRSERELENFIKAIRESRDLTQAELAKCLKVKQGSISKFEHRSDIHISTLRKYLDKLGAQLEIRATFKDGDVTIVEFKPRAVSTRKGHPMKKQRKSTASPKVDKRTHQTGSKK